MVAAVKSDNPALGFSYSISLDDKRSVVLQTFLPHDCAGSQLDAMLDKMRVSVERQAAHHSIPQLKKSLAMQRKQFKRVTEDLAFQDDMAQAAFKASGKKGTYRLTSEQEKHRSNVKITQARFQEEIDELVKEIAAAEAVVNGANSSPDS